MEGRGDMDVEQASATYIKKLHDFLHQDAWYTPLCEKLEKIVNVKREYLVLGASALILGNLALGYGGQLICHFIGVLYPVLKTVQVIELKDNEQSMKWLMYWVVFASLNFIEFSSFFLLNCIPCYWLIKCLFLTWCFAPVVNNGSLLIYHNVVCYLFYKMQEKIDEINDPTYEEGSSLGESDPPSQTTGNHRNLRSRRKTPSE